MDLDSKIVDERAQIVEARYQKHLMEANKPDTRHELLRYVARYHWTPQLEPRVKRPACMLYVPGRRGAGWGF